MLSFIYRAGRPYPEVSGASNEMLSGEEIDRIAGISGKLPS
jgi:hypothetical protein